MKNTIGPRSLHARLMAAVLLCWILPVMSVMVLAGSLIGRSYERSLQQELEGRAANALEQIAMRMDAVFEASKAVSYDGVVRNSYRLFQRDGDKAVLYRVVTDYLKQNFDIDLMLNPELTVFTSYLYNLMIGSGSLPAPAS